MYIVLSPQNRWNFIDNILFHSHSEFLVLFSDCVAKYTKARDHRFVNVVVVVVVMFRMHY